MSLGNATQTTKKASIYLLLAAFILSPAANVYAISDSDQHSILNDTIFYDPTAIDLCSSDVAVNISLSQAIISAINQNKSVYQQASQKTGVPWELFAGVHFEETGLTANRAPANGQGVYQDTTGGYPTGPIDQAEFLRESVIFGNKIQNDYVNRNLPNHRGKFTGENADPEKVKDTMFSWNGRASFYAQQAKKLGFDPVTQPYEGSAYVMNEFDGVHKDMVLFGGQIDYRDGAFVVYAALTGSIPCASGSAAGTKIVAIAASQLGIKENPDGSNCVPPTNNKFTAPAPGRCEEWCADFVSWVYNQAGVPFTGGWSGWDISYTLSMRDWFKTHGQWFDRASTKDIPQPGDVFLELFGEGGHHVGIVEKVASNTLYTIEGNAGNAVSARTYSNYRSYTVLEGWGRLK